MKRMGRFGLCFALILATFSLIAAPQAAHAAVGDVDTSVTLNGSTQYAWVADDNSLDVANALTVEAWVKPTSISTCGSSDTCIILNKESSYELAIYNGTYQHAILGTSTGTWAFQDTGVKAIINEWHHVAITRALNTYTTKFYLDGVLAATDSSGDGAGTSTISNSIYPFTIGARSSNGVTFTSKFTGQIDEVKVWGVERSATNVVSDMSNWGPTNTSGLQLYYDFNDISGSPDTVVNRVSGATSASTLSLGNSPTVSDVKTTDTTTAPGYTILKFTRSYLNANGGWMPPANVNNVDYLVVGGGGGAGWNSGGGGSGGGVDSGTSFTVTGSQTVVVGSGGAASTSVSINGGSGGGSTFENVNVSGGNGGRGTPTFAGGASVQGSGKGGAGSTSSTTPGQSGDTGTVSSITGIQTYYAGGGGGGGWQLLTKGGAGGAGGGGDGGGTNPGTGTFAGASGTVNTGGGGGANSSGSSSVVGFGGSGIVIIRYKNYFGTSVSISVNPKKSTKSATATPITATTTSTGTVTFYANGRIINGCKNVVVSGTTATCNWRPMTQGSVTLSASYTSNDSLYSGTVSSAAITTSVSKRTTAR